MRSIELSGYYRGVERAVYPIVLSELSRQFAVAAYDVRSRGVRLWAISSFNDGVLFRTQRVGLMVSYRAVSKLGGSKSDVMQKLVKDTEASMRMHNLRYVQGINDSSRNALLRLFNLAMRERWGRDKMATEILRLGARINPARARRIAVTEATRGLGMGAMVTAMALPFVVAKRWISSGDDRVRSSPYLHRLDSLGEIPLERPFYNGQDIMYPGDPNASASNTVNCRCTLGLVPVLDAAGRLIPKRQIDLISSLNAMPI